VEKRTNLAFLKNPVSRAIWLDWFLDGLTVPKKLNFQMGRKGLLKRKKGPDSPQQDLGNPLPGEMIMYVYTLMKQVSKKNDSYK
jgi:hypothetical protein